MSWRFLPAWDSPVLYVMDGQKVYSQLKDGTIQQDVSTDPSLAQAPFQSFQDMLSLGPTSGTVSVPVPFTFGHLSFGTHVEFNVTIPTGRGMLLDQDSTLQTLIVQGGASLQTQSGNNLAVKGALINNGSLLLGGPASAQSFINTGQFTIAKGGSFAAPSPFANDGFISVTGGVFSSNNLTNFSSILCSDGVVSLGGSVTNSGAIACTNSGTVSISGSTLNNQIAGLVDLQGNGIISGFNLHGTINNAGTVRKSTGTGTSDIDEFVAFNNTGTVEVDSGTLSFDGGGTSTKGSYVFANGGRALLTSAGVFLSGTTTGTGDGLVELTGAQFYNFGSNMAVLNFTGNSRVKLNGGVIDGRTNVILNAGSMELVTGTIEDQGLANTGVIACTGSGTVSLSNSSLSNQIGGLLDLQGDGTLSGFNTHGTINNAGTIRKSGGTGSSHVDGWVTFNNTGTVEVDSGTLSFDGGGTWTNGSYVFANGGRVLLTSAGVFLSGTTTGTGDGLVELTGAQFYNFGSNVAVLNFAGNSRVKVNGGVIDARTTVILNAGNMELVTGTIEDQGLANTGVIACTGSGTISISNSALINQIGGLVDLQGDGIISGFNTRGTIINAGTFRKSGGAGTSRVDGWVTFNNTGTVEVDSGTLELDGSYVQTAGITALEGGNIAGNLNLLGGLMKGSGLVAGTISNSAGMLSPGNSPGTIAISGNYSQGSNADLIIEIAGDVAGQFDVVNVAGSASLNGELDISLINGFSPYYGETFRVLTYGSHSGSFASVNDSAAAGWLFTPTYDATGVTLTAVPEPTPQWLTLGVLAVLLSCRARFVGRRPQPGE